MRVIRLSLPENGIWEARAHGQRIMDLISIRVAGMWVVHGVDSSLPTLTQIWNPVRTGISYPPARPRNGRLY